MSARSASAGRVEALTSWHHDWRGVRVAVLGAGRTGFSAADTLVELGCTVAVIAASVDPQRADLLDVLGVPVTCGDPAAQAETLRTFAPDLVIASPGYHPDAPVFAVAEHAGAVVWGDIELAWRLRDRAGEPAEWITITGTNGKTTTTRLVVAMLTAAGVAARACGNIGDPVLDAIREPTPWRILAVELSSYQLHHVHTVSPLASVCLNIADDHLDWHGGRAAYRAAKGRVYEHTRVACVYNVEDPVTEELVRETDVVEGARAIGFTLGPPRVGELGVVDGVLCDRAFVADRLSRAQELTTLEALGAEGLAAPHIVADVLAAAALVRAAGVPAAAVRDALGGFRLDPHRIEVVAVRDGVTWIDDSKATNPHAADASLAAFDPVVWIVGGLLKGVDPAPLVAKHAARLRGAVVIGREQALVLEALARHAPEVPVRVVDPGDTGAVMSRAVALAAGLAQPGDTVLLAPAAASMDQFTDYEHRGALFRAAVRHESV